MNARSMPRRRAASQRWLIAGMVTVNIAGVAAIVTVTGDAHQVALGVLPLAMLLAAFA